MHDLDLASLIQTGGAGILAFALKLLFDHGKELSALRQSVDELRRKLEK